MDIKIICYKNNRGKDSIIEAVKMLNAVQNYFFYTLIKEDYDVVADEKIDWTSFLDTKGSNIDEHTIFITEKPFYDNWFSHEDSKFSIITTNDWEAEFAPPSLSSYLIYQIAQASINFDVALSKDLEKKMLHLSTAGCMFDFCSQKEDIKLGMVAGIICPECKNTLLRLGIKKDALKAIERILSYVRSEAIGKPMKLNENEAFVIMPFSNNDENDDSYKQGIRPALEALGIKCSRADDNIASMQLLQKIRQCIEECRFIIAKVDSNNPNVYFELGLAMGLNKDILLISEKDLVEKLPSDLNNWECLTYPKGDYTKLKQQIVKYYKDNYHY